MNHIKKRVLYVAFGFIALLILCVLLFSGFDFQNRISAMISHRAVTTEKVSQNNTSVLLFRKHPYSFVVAGFMPSFI